MSQQGAVALALALLALTLSVDVPSVSGDRAPNKPFMTFGQFYPFVQYVFICDTKSFWVASI